VKNKASSFILQAFSRVTFTTNNLKIMRKIFSLILSVLVMQSYAQITITQSDLPIVGTYYINATDSNYVASIPAGGAAQSWNFSTLLNNVQDTLGFISSVGTPYAANFPLANLAGYDVNSNSWVYFISSSTGFYINGGFSTAFFGGIVLKYNPAQLIIPAPFTYNNTRVSNYRFEYADTTSIIPTADSVKYIINGTITMIGDGYGSLTLPNATYPNTLRIKSTDLRSDTIQVKIPILGWNDVSVTQTQTTNYRWVKNGTASNALLLEISADSAGQTSETSSYLLNSGVVAVSNEVKNESKTTAYPTPAKDFITFNFNNRLNSDAVLVIYNVQGQKVKQINVGNLDIFTTSINLFVNGVYFYNVVSTNGIEDKGRFVVNK